VLEHGAPTTDWAAITTPILVASLQI
jgi:hypothetical protein